MPIATIADIGGQRRPTLPQKDQRKLLKWQMPKIRPDADLDVTGALSAVGGRLRDLRRKHDLTLEELSERTAISVSTLSRVESGSRRPTLDVLLPLSRLFGVTLDDVVRPPNADPRVVARQVRRNGVIHLVLSRRSDGLIAMKATYPGTTAQGTVRRTTHPGFDWLYVLSGQLRLVLGDQEFILTAGEAAEFETHIPHGFASATASTTEVLHLMSPLGRKAHLGER